MCGTCGRVHRVFYDHKVRWIRDLPCGDTRVYLEVAIRRVFCQTCRSVKQEQLTWLAHSPLYTKRFAFFVGRRCRASPIRDVARELALDWKTVKALDTQYMREQLRRSGTPGPQIIGIDEVSIKKGHTYRIVVSDLVRRRAIWFGGKDRSEASMDGFYQWLGPKKSHKIRLTVMGTCGRLSAPPPSSQSTRRRPPFCSTSSTSCATGGRPSTRSASVNMRG